VTAAASIALREVTFRYPKATADALDGLTLDVEAGERVAVLGPNGSGKTTLALHLNGLLRCQRGKITIGDVTLNDDTLTGIRRRVGSVFQDADDQLFTRG
jgi:cobalt/nickel transport system ATP-binding protein